MFTGLVETIGKVRHIYVKKRNRILAVGADFASELKEGESVAVQGCCLTVVSANRSFFTVEVVGGTLEKTTLGELRIGSEVNLERALKLGERVGGHLVLGHIDEVGVVRGVVKKPGETEVTIAVNPDSPFLVEKGSVAVDGVSLTIAETGRGEFKVRLVPLTLKRTTLGKLRSGDRVNIEYDILVKSIRQGQGRNPSV